MNAERLLRSTHEANNTTGASSSVFQYHHSDEAVNLPVLIYNGSSSMIPKTE